MATKVSSREDRKVRKLSEQHHPFVGLFLTPLIGLLVTWLIHAYTVGVHVAWGPINWQAPGSPAAVVLTACLLTLGAVGLAYAGWTFAEHRKPAFRKALAGSSFAIGALFAVSTGIGPHYWWSLVFVLTGWYAATMWSLARLNVTRQDPREDGEKEGGGLLEKWGIKGFTVRKHKVVHGDDGEPARIEVEVQHAPGETIEPLQGAVKNMESSVAGPAGMSRAVPTDRADRSNVTLMLADALKGRLPYGPPSAEGGSIEQPLLVGTYDDGHPVWCYLAGGPGFSPTSYLFMGMTRTGKTVAENEALTEVIGRRDAVILYLNKAKGMQDVRPIIPGVEVAILSDDVGDYVSAFNRIKGMMTHRSKVLGEYGISRWSAKTCFYNPPQRKANGDPVPMEPLPFLIVHAGEADAVLERESGEATYVASKGLSLGVNLGLSLQRASAEHMPTSLRFNIGAKFCFGCGDNISVGMALSDATIAAGAHPENWGQRKPGYFYFEGPGVDDVNFPKVAKTASKAHTVVDGDDDDTIDAKLQEEMLRRNLKNGPLMARLDRGSALATGTDGTRCWWDMRAAQTANLRNTLLGGTANSTANPTANMTASDRKPAAPTPQPWTAEQEESMPQFAATPPPAGVDADTAEAQEAIRAEIEGMTNFEGLNLYPPDENGETAEHLTGPIPDPPAGQDLTWADPRPAPVSRGDAISALHDVLVQLKNDPAFRDSADDDVALIRVNDIHERYPFRSRPWFSEELARLARGEATGPPSLILSEAEEYPLSDRRYRLRWAPEIDSE